MFVGAELYISILQPKYYQALKQPQFFITLPETNIFAPENGWLEYYFPIGMAYFQVLR